MSKRQWQASLPLLLILLPAKEDEVTPPYYCPCDFCVYNDNPGDDAVGHDYVVQGLAPLVLQHQPTPGDLSRRS